MSDIQAYGLWPLVIINSLIIIIFAFSFTRPKTSRDWRSFGGFSAFIVALFTEMYGFPLTIYLLSSWLGSRYPEIDLLSHDAGHLTYTLLGMKGDPHLGFIHLISNIFILGGSLFTHRVLESSLCCPAEPYSSNHWSVRFCSSSSI